MPSTAFFGVAAGVLSLVAFVPYVRSILAGQTKPERASWAKWTLAHWLLLVLPGIHVAACARGFRQNQFFRLAVPISPLYLLKINLILLA